MNEVTKTSEELKDESEILESKRTRCEVYSRVVGYIRPVDSWNEGKKAEFEDRLMFEI